MPTPNKGLPTAAPDRLPRADFCRAWLAVKEPGIGQPLRDQHGAGKGKQPHRQLAAREIARKFDHGRAQAET